MGVITVITVITVIVCDHLADQGVEGGDHKRGAEDQEQVTAGEIVCLVAPELSRHF